MKHLDDSTALKVSEGSETFADLEHLSKCGRCRQLVQWYSDLIYGLNRSEEEPPQSLLSWARAYAHLNRPERKKTSILDFLAGGAHALAGVRSGQTIAGVGHTALWGNGKHHLDLRIEALSSGRAEIHGQIVPLAGQGFEEWTITVVARDGRRHSTVTDASGEFYFSELQQWRGSTIVAQGENFRLVIPRVDPDGPQDESA